MPNEKTDSFKFNEIQLHCLQEMKSRMDRLYAAYDKHQIKYRDRHTPLADDEQFKKELHNPKDLKMAVKSEKDTIKQLKKTLLKALRNKSNETKKDIQDRREKIREMSKTMREVRKYKIPCEKVHVVNHGNITFNQYQKYLSNPEKFKPPSKPPSKKEKKEKTKKTTTTKKK